ncbi:Calx-beta domain-containing protein [Cellulophaga sp. L1A9]|uniref:Calx-beta domain-containing protein n=1 Tax=Cellulophaga sp. L1A9 TaxID=2686362 RepID=UPI00131B8176|nr:Calx-beta domain-containing protein [Cellulophaga sp. L1A9]
MINKIILTFILLFSAVQMVRAQCSNTEYGIATSFAANITNTNNILGAPNNQSTVFGANSQLVVRLANPVLVGTQITIRLRRNTNNAGLLIYNSDQEASGYNNLAQYNSTNTALGSTINVTYTANRTIEYLLFLGNSNNGETFSVDAISYCAPDDPNILVDDVSISENSGSAIFNAVHDGSATAGSFSVNYLITAGSATAGVDYTTSSGVYTGTLNFNGTSGDTEQITVLITDDLDFEGPETYTISFTSVSDASVVITDTATGTINDNDIPANTPLTLFSEFNGYFDYALTGGSLRDTSNPTTSIVASSSNTLTTAVPATAQIKKAYLFWTHSGATPDLSITFENQTVAADYANQYVISSLSFYALFADVTTLINGIGVSNLNSTTFDFSDLNVDNSGSYASGNVTLGGWSLMIFYEEPTLPAVSINLYQGFIGYQNTSTPVSFALDGFYAISTVGAKATFLSWEGDPSSGGELLSLTTSLGTNELSGDGDNIGAVDNPFNGTIFDNTVVPNINNTTTFGLDLDTYDISTFIAPAESSVTANV